MTGKLVIENLKHKPMRSLLSFLLIGVPVTLMLTLVGLSHGMIADSQRRARGSGADIMVRGTNAKAALTQSSATLPDFRASLPQHNRVFLKVEVDTDADEFRRTVRDRWNEEKKELVQPVQLLFFDVVSIRLRERQ